MVEKIRPGNTVLDLGCGYGRIIPELATKAATVIGIDLSYGSLDFGRQMLSNTPNHRLVCMDAVSLGFKDQSFDVVVCIQNGISAFHVDKTLLISESVRVTKTGGIVLFSTYSDRFWDDRLEWFEIQAEEGLLGEIDYERTGNGVIVCKDGFTATTITVDQFRSLVSGMEAAISIIEVDGSSLFCEITRR